MAVVKDVANLMETWAPQSLAESWDHVGLQVGNYDQAVHKILVSLDLTSEVAKEAVETESDLIITHHPLIFSPLTHLDPQDPIGKTLYCLASKNIAFYAAHTNLDIISPGVADVLADLMELETREPLEVTSHQKLVKLVTFAPEDAIEDIQKELFHAGAGKIGSYSECSFVSEGFGSFLPHTGTKPYVGTIGRRNQIGEQRLEVLVPENLLSGVIAALKKAHPYEEPAYDLYTLKNSGIPQGIGRVGTLRMPGSLSEIADRAARILKSSVPKMSGDPCLPVQRLAVSGGSGKGLVEIAVQSKAQALLTGDLDHHEGIKAMEMGLGLIVLGHYATEFPIVPKIAEYLRKNLESVEVNITSVNTDPYFRI